MLFFTFFSPIPPPASPYAHHYRVGGLWACSCFFWETINLCVQSISYSPTVQLGKLADHAESLLSHECHGFPSLCICRFKRPTPFARYQGHVPSPLGMGEMRCEFLFFFFFFFFSPCRDSRSNNMGRGAFRRPANDYKGPSSPCMAAPRTKDSVRIAQYMDFECNPTDTTGGSSPCYST